MAGRSRPEEWSRPFLRSGGRDPAGRAATQLAVGAQLAGAATRGAVYQGESRVGRRGRTWSRASMGAPFSTSRRAQRMWPEPRARCNGVTSHFCGAIRRIFSQLHGATGRLYTARSTVAVGLGEVTGASVGGAVGKARRAVKYSRGARLRRTQRWRLQQGEPSCSRHGPFQPPTEAASSPPAQAAAAVPSVCHSGVDDEGKFRRFCTRQASRPRRVSF